MTPDDWGIRSLTAEEEAARISALEMAGRMVGHKPPLSVDQVQELYDAFRQSHREFDAGQIAVGMAFGELIVAKAGYEWVQVSDEYGTETSLSPLGVMGACHPVSMIQKRLEQDEDVDIAELRDATIDLIQRRIEEGLWTTR